tara:strand:+ start:103 stop:978 length:876 start_codon:yes stop_codon:yes gene_type:complete
MLPGGVLAVTSELDTIDTSRGSHHIGVNFVAARNDSDPQALAACQASSLAARHFEWPTGVALTNDGLLMCSLDQTTALYKFAKEGSMEELAMVPVLADYDRGFRRCQVHQQTQRTYAIGVDEDGNQALVLLDASLQVVATVEATGDVPEDSNEEEYEPIRDVAVHGDQVIVLASDSHAKGSGLRLLDLDGRFVRTIAAGQFQNPQAVAASHGRAFVIDDDDDDDDNDEGTGFNVLCVIDIQSGDIIQRLRVDLGGGASAMIVDGDEIYIAASAGAYGPGFVLVLQLAGSEV